MILEHLPWRIRHLVQQTNCNYKYYSANLFNLFRASDKRGQSIGKKICFVCGFHGRSGGTQAIASIANLLSESYTVYFVLQPTSLFNILLKRKIRRGLRIDFSSDFFIVDVACDLDLVKQIRRAGKPIIVSCHELPRSGHGLTEERVYESLKVADYIHFVSKFQASAFKGVLKPSVVIENTVWPVSKSKRTQNVGIIGNPHNPLKNVEKAIKCAKLSNAKKIHVWGASDYKKDERVIYHPWCDNKTKIYNSFDVLIHLSKAETFGLVVGESLSCGISCVVSNIPVFKMYSSCKAVHVTSNENGEIIKAINFALASAKSRGNEAKRYWEERFSPPVISKKWVDFLSQI